MNNTSVLKRIIFDESHCVKEHGLTFRSQYINVCTVIKNLNCQTVPISFYTATFRPDEINFILAQFGLQHCVFRLNYSSRLNMTINVVDLNNIIETQNPIFGGVRQDLESLLPNNLLTPNTRQYILHLLHTRLRNQCGIIYCLSRKDVEALSGYLDSYGVSVTYFHAKIEENTKTLNTRYWTTGRKLVIVAASAFGLGISKGDVRLVIHASVPPSLTSFVQQIGRAGRDNNPCEVFLIYHFADRRRYSTFH